MLTETQNRFLSLEQGVIFHIGRLEGLIGSANHFHTPELEAELVEIKDGLRDLVRAEAARKSSDIPN